MKHPEHTVELFTFPVGEEAERNRFATHSYLIQSILLGLVLLVCCLSSSAQLTNEEIYTQKSLEIVEGYSYTPHIQFLEGLVTEGIRARIQLDPEANNNRIEFYLEELRYKPLGKGKFARFLQGSVNLVDGSEKPSEWSYADTLTRKQLTQVRKTKVVELKGKNPGVVGKLVVPFVAIAASVGVVIALFYVRTQ